MAPSAWLKSLTQTGLGGPSSSVKTDQRSNMHVKIDTKEKFHVIRIDGAVLTADLAEEIRSVVKDAGQGSIRNLVLNLSGVTDCSPEAAREIALLQQQAYDEGRSFVICCMAKNIESLFDDEELLDVLNLTPTESEAWDIVQMEEIEREMLGED